MADRAPLVHICLVFTISLTYIHVGDFATDQFFSFSLCSLVEGHRERWSWGGGGTLSPVLPLAEAPISSEPYILTCYLLIHDHVLLLNPWASSEWLQKWITWIFHSSLLSHLESSSYSENSPPSLNSQELVPGAMSILPQPCLHDHSRLGWKVAHDTISLSPLEVFSWD